MIRQQYHIIRKNTVTVNAVTSDGFALQSTISRILNREVVDRLEYLFDTLSDEEEWLVIDTVEININAYSIEELERNLADLIIEKVKAQLQDRFASVKEGKRSNAGFSDHPTENKMLNRQDRSLEAFVYFLEKGNLPWWYTLLSHTGFENDLLSLFQTLALEKDYHSTEQYVATLSKVLKQEIAARRLVYQFNKDVVMAVLTLLMRQHPDLTAEEVQRAYEEIVKIINAKRTHATKNIWQQLDVWLIQKIAIPGGVSNLIIGEWFGEIIFRLYQHDPQYIIKAVEKNKILKKYTPIPLRVPDVITNWDLGSDLPSTKPSEVHASGFKYAHQEKDKYDANMAQEGVQILNAGLVIVAPFLEHFFSACNLLTEGSINDNNKALALLHYMAFGNIEYHEYDLVLPKILCGVDEKEPVEIVSFLSMEELDHVNDLLQSVIENWSALKSTSPDGLRETFLQRKGILVFNDDTWQLQVEQNAVDILLESLPWTIGYIKLSWMENVLKTQWT